MNSKMQVTVVVSIIIICLGAVALIYLYSSQAHVLTVDAAGGADFQTIQAAICAASPGDTIYVNPGIYEETLQIDTPLSIKGTNRSSTIIKNTNVNESTVIEITADCLGGSNAV